MNQYEFDYKRIIQILHSRSEVFNLIGRNDHGLKDIRKGLKIARKYGDKKSEADCLLQLSEIYHSISKYEQTLSSAKASLLMYQEINDKRGEASSLNNIGLVHYCLGDYPRALEYCSKSLKIREEIGDRRGQTTSLNNIARGYIEQGEWARAREYLTRTEKIASEIGEKEVLRRAAVSFGELILAETAKKGTENAKIYAEESLKLADELKSKLGKAEALLLQARIEAAQIPLNPPLLKGESEGDFSPPLEKGESKGNWQIADSRFKEAISIFEELKQPFEIAKAYYYYSEMPKVKGERKTAVDYLQKAKEIF
ncbi:MAG: tetratricopeptide repeat protein [Candidatus Edwardsbacteria bacterium]